jgi:hypothetical protein
MPEGLELANETVRFAGRSEATAVGLTPLSGVSPTAVE